jgi:hypothetical protein
MAKTAAKVRFKAQLLRPQSAGRAVTWMFLTVPKAASARLGSRGRAAVEGTLNGVAFRAMLEPDGQMSHWLKVPRKLRAAAGARADDRVDLELSPAGQVPEPNLPVDLRKALAGAPKARAVWRDISPIARRDWIHWVVSAKQAQTRARRIANACDMLGSGKRRVCCFDRSGFYAKNLRAPTAASRD